jgi:hypothetical protein
MIEIKHDVSAREIRVFGLLWLLFLGGLGAMAVIRPGGLVGAATILGAAWIASLVWNTGLPRRTQMLGAALPLSFGAIGGAVTSGASARGVALALGAIGVAGALAIWIAPAFGRSLYMGWMVAALPIGWSISHAVLALVYYLVFTPIGLLMRLAGHDPLRRSFERGAASYWIARPNDPDPRRAFRQF